MPASLLELLLCRGPPGDVPKVSPESCCCNFDLPVFESCNSMTQCTDHSMASFLAPLPGASWCNGTTAAMCSFSCPAEDRQTQSNLHLCPVACSSDSGARKTELLPGAANELNEPAFDIEIAHLHFRKAGGTTMRRYLGEQAAALARTGRSVWIVNNEMSAFDVGMFCDRHASRRYITVMRHPWARLVSLFNYEGNPGVATHGAANSNATAWHQWLDQYHTGSLIYGYIPNYFARRLLAAAGGSNRQQFDSFRGGCKAHDCTAGMSYGLCHPGGNFSVTFSCGPRPRGEGIDHFWPAHFTIATGILKRFDYVGILELMSAAGAVDLLHSKFPETLAAFNGAAYGHKRTSAVRSNMTLSIPAEILTRFNKENTLDLRLYEHARAAFEQSLRAYR